MRTNYFLPSVHNCLHVPCFDAGVLPCLFGPYWLSLAILWLDVSRFVARLFFTEVSPKKAKTHPHHCSWQFFIQCQGSGNLWVLFFVGLWALHRVVSLPFSCGWRHLTPSLPWRCHVVLTKVFCSPYLTIVHYSPVSKFSPPMNPYVEWRSQNQHFWSAKPTFEGHLWRIRSEVTLFGRPLKSKN